MAAVKHFHFRFDAERAHPRGHRPQHVGGMHRLLPSPKFMQSRVQSSGAFIEQVETWLTNRLRRRSIQAAALPDHRRGHVMMTSGFMAGTAPPGGWRATERGCDDEALLTVAEMATADRATIDVEAHLIAAIFN